MTARSKIPVSKSVIDQKSIGSTRIANRILAALPPDEYKRILPKLEEVPLILDTMICDFGDRIH